jgi:hypothetical protein
LKKICHFTKLLEKLSYDVHMFTWQVAVLPAASRSATFHSPSHRCQYNQSDAWLQQMLVEFVIMFHYMQNLSSVNPLCLLRRFPCKSWSKNMLFWLLNRKQKYEKNWKWRQLYER